MILNNLAVGLVAAEAIARSNILQTAMVQAQGLTASIEALLSWIKQAETNLRHMKAISLNKENLEDQLAEFKVRLLGSFFIDDVITVIVKSYGLAWSTTGIQC